MMNNSRFFALAVAVILLGAGAASAFQIYVPLMEPTIALGLEAAAPGDTVMVYGGGYEESNLVIPAGVHLIGFGPDPLGTWIDAQEHGRVLTIEGGDTQIANIRLTGGWTARGGGVHVDAGNIRLTHVAIDGNYAGNGAGLFIAGGSVEMIRCVVVNNTAESTGGGIQAMKADQLSLTDCLIHNNTAGIMGGAWHVSLSDVQLNNCTVDGNQAPVGAEGVCFGSVPVVIDHGIASNNQLAGSPVTLAGTFYSDHASRPQHECSLRWQDDGDAWPGFLAAQLADAAAANLDAHPGYCRDEGTWESYFGLNGNSPALPEEGGCGLRGAFGQMCDPVGTPDVPALADRLYPAHPNPFNPSTTIQYDVARSGPVSLKIYSLDGRCVATLVNEEAAAGRHEVQWMGRDQAGRGVSSGVYLARLMTADGPHAIRMTLVK